MREVPCVQARIGSWVNGGGAAGAWAGFSSPALDIVSLAAKPRC
jgi:hypothetical protein